MEDMMTYAKDYLVPYSYCDLKGRMTLCAILKEAQQISMEHCDHLGMGSSFMQKVNRAFLLAKIAVSVNRMPQGGERVTLITVPYMPVRAQYKRDTQVLDQNGNILVAINSIWILVDLSTRKIMAHKPEDMPIEQFYNIQKVDDIRFPKNAQLEKQETVKVRFCHLDNNNHVNNAVYADMVLNALEDQLMEDKHLKKFSIIYHNEAVYHDQIDLMIQKGPVNLVRGMVGSSHCFDSMVEFQEDGE